MICSTTPARMTGSPAAALYGRLLHDAWNMVTERGGDQRIKLEGDRHTHRGAGRLPSRETAAIVDQPIQQCRTGDSVGRDGPGDGDGRARDGH